jgi:hypothetical protein
VPAECGKISIVSGERIISKLETEGGIETEGDKDRAKHNEPLISSLKTTSLDT